MRYLPLVFVLGCLSAPHGIETSDVYKVYNQDKAMIYAQGEFNSYYKTHVRAFDDAVVNWTETECPYSDGWAVVVDKRCYHGIMWGCDEIYVALSQTDYDTSTCGTALMHEFGHCLRMQAGWGGDSDHEDEPFWEFMEGARKETCERGW